MADTLGYIGLWYGLNVGYNLYNKDLCNNFGKSAESAFSLTIATTSLGAGLLYILFVWGLRFRPIPRLEVKDVKNLLVNDRLYSLYFAILGFV